MPDRFHLMMIWMAMAVLVIAFVMHFMLPGDDVYVSAIATAMGFLFGKFSNGYRKKEDTQA